METRPLIGALACAVAICALALAPAASHAATPAYLGAATHPLWDEHPELMDSKAELDRLVEAGANAVRIDINWSSLEEVGRGQHTDWYVRRADAFFAEARARGLKVIATFWATPCWASTAPPEVKQDCAGEWWEREVERYPPADPADFARAAAWVADRWEGDLAALEIWNEPNCGCWFKLAQPEQPGQRVAAYTAMLRAAYGEVKAAAPSVEVLGGSLLFSHDEFLEALYAAGAKGHMDGVSVRPFSQWRDPTDKTVPESGRMYSLIHGVEDLRATMADNADSATPLWFTEIGWSSCTPGLPNSSHWCVSQELQAQYVGAALRVVRDRWDFVRGVAVYSLRNKSDSDDRESQMGLLHRNFDPKPAFAAFKEALADLAADPFTKPLIPPATGSGTQPDAAAPDGDPVVTLDVEAPVVRRMTLSRRVLRRTGARPVLRFALSERALVTVRFTRMRAGRAVRLRGVLRHRGRRGRNAIAIRGVVRGRRLPPGRYRVWLLARDAAGNVTRTGWVPLRVVR